MTEPKILVSMATYKEKDNLEPLIREIHKHLPAADVLVIDDNSPDGTGAVADRLAAADPRIHVIHRPGKQGLGTAILRGMKFALDNGYDYFLNVDADFSHHPKYLPAMIEGMKKNDVTIGSRYVPTGGTLNWPLSRQMMSKGVNTMVRLLMRIPARDTSGGYRCYRVNKLKGAGLDQMISYGYSFQEEVLYRCWKAGCKIGETPIIFEDRKVGASKANVKEMVRSLGILVYLGIGTMFGVVR
jgi:dolichol-phosphate mannosyltransferase